MKTWKRLLLILCALAAIGIGSWPSTPACCSHRGSLRRRVSLDAPPNRYDTPSTNVNYLDTVRYLTFDVLLILFSFHKVQMTDLRRCASLSRHFLTFPMAS